MLSTFPKDESGYALHSLVTVVAVLFAGSDLGLSFFSKACRERSRLTTRTCVCDRQTSTISSWQMRRRLIRLRIGSATRGGSRSCTRQAAARPIAYEPRCREHTLTNRNRKFISINRFIDHAEMDVFT
jgi:hypothetical protein